MLKRIASSTSKGMSCFFSSCGLATQAGLVAGAGMSASWAQSPYLARSSSMGPKSSARIGHDSTHSGIWPFSKRSMHIVHLLALVPGSSLANLMAP